MKMGLALVAVGLGLLAGRANGDKVTFHVAPDGDDGNPGIAAKPLRSPAGVRDAVRRLQAERRSRPPREIEVVFHDGVYHVEAAVAFGAVDSAVQGQTVVYRAASRGAAVFDGGMRLDWKPLGPNDPAAKLIPASVHGRVKTAEIPPSQELPALTGGRRSSNLFPAWLYAGGRAAPIAAWPDASDDWGDLYREFADADYTEEIQASNRADGRTMRFICREKGHLGAWVREPDLWVYGMWAFLWDDTTVQMLSADSKTGIVTIDAKDIPAGYSIGREGHLYRVVNALSEMDRPGEWVIDRGRRRVYRVADGEDPVMSSAKGLLWANGLTNVVFDGISFRHARGDALRFDECRGIRLRGCTVSACGGWAVKIAGGSDCRVEGCDIHHVGEGGIVMSGGERATLTKCGHAAVNNHVHHWGERLPIYRAAIALGPSRNGAAAYVCGALVEHNLIHHGRHEAIQFEGNFNDIRWNVIHDVCACSRDCGAIYGYNARDWSLSRGTRIEHNCIYMAGRPNRGGMFFAIYVDGFVSGVTVRKNICIGSDAGLMSQGGHANVYENNLVALCTHGAYRCNLGGKGNGYTRADSVLWKAMQRDKAMFQAEPWKSAFPELESQSRMTDAELAQSTMAVVFRDNVFAASGPCVWKDADRLGKYNTVTNNLVLEEGDPGFVDYAHHDFRLAPGSAAFRIVGDLGFDKMGITNGPDRASAAVRFGEGVTEPPELDLPTGPASIRIDLQYSGPKKFTKDSPIATEFVNCELPKWNPPGDRISGRNVKLARDGKWVDYEIAFTPAITCTLSLELMGNLVKRTCVDDVRVEGAMILNGGFEGSDGWSAPIPVALGDKTIRLDRFGPHASDANNRAPEGMRFAVVNHDVRMHQRICVEAGRRVTIRCRATAWRDGEARGAPKAVGGPATP